MPNPNREAHELKEEQPDGHKQGYQSSTPASPKRRVGSAARMPEARASIATWPRLTGTYLGVDSSFYLHVNQAGPHLELLVAFMESGSSSKAATYPHDTSRSETRLVRMGGDRIDEAQRIYELYIEPDGARSTMIAAAAAPFSSSVTPRTASSGASTWAWRSRPSAASMTLRSSQSSPTSGRSSPSRSPARRCCSGATSAM